jgi:hypothetical protein
MLIPVAGLFFPKAMNHIFVGLYIEQICLCALMVVLIAITVSLYHVAGCI